jgi:GST-like protein
MIDFYGYGTANGHKVALMLEETGLPYTFHYADMAKGAHLTADYLKVNPIGKIPAIVDHDGPGGKPLSVFETQVIAQYLAEKSGKLMPKDFATRTIAAEWATHITANLAPAFSAQFYITSRLKGENPTALEYYVGQIHRCIKPIEARLGEMPYMTGTDCSYVDVLLYPMMVVSGARLANGGLDPYPNIKAWVAKMGERPGIQRGMAVIKP